ncbi:MAG: sporulation protein YqfD [Clostridia bacterium]|nr:sporulation protein YqfD [Clostridia bacterium]
MGEILFSIDTFMGAKLLSHAAENGVCVHDVSAPNEHTLNVWVSGRDEKNFRTLIEKYSLPYKVIAVRGRARALRSLRSHAFLAAGLIIGIALIYILSLRIWFLDVSGAGSEIRESLYRAGVSVGCRKSGVDVSAVSRLLEAENPEFAHIGVKISGVALKINCVKAESAPGVFDITKTRDLTAKADGVIVDINVFAGQAKVKSGDTVLKGDILILGQERAGRDGEVSFVRAEGTVTARVWTKGESAVNLVIEKQVRTGRAETTTEIQTPFFTRKLAGENPFHAFEAQARESKLVGLFVPIRLIHTTFYELKTENAFIDKDAAEKTAFESALAKARKNAPEGAAELRHWADFKKQDENTIVCTAVVEWIMDIAESRQGG